jgi:hypothetical protein
MTAGPLRRLQEHAAHAAYTGWVNARGATKEANLAAQPSECKLTPDQF